MKIDEREFDIRKPNYKQLTEAQLYSSKVFSEAVKAGVTLRVNLDDELQKRGAWTEDKTKKLIEITAELNEICDNLAKGKKGVYKKLSEARKAAIKARQLRYEQTQLLLENRKLDAYTAEGLAEQARFDYLVSLCVYENGSRVFPNIDNYLERAGDNWAKECARELSYILYPDNDRNWEMNLPENEFLTKNNLVDKDGSLINKDGNLVDENLQLLNRNEVVEYEELENDLWQNQDS